MTEYAEMLKICEFYLGNYVDQHLRPSIRPRGVNVTGAFDHENPSYMSCLFYCLLVAIGNRDTAKLVREYYSQFILKNSMQFNDSLHGLVQRQPFGKNYYNKNHPDFDIYRQWNNNSKDEAIGYFTLFELNERIILIKNFINKNFIIDDHEEYFPPNKRFLHPITNQWYYLKISGMKTTLKHEIANKLDRFFDIFMRVFFASGDRKKDKGKFIEKIRRPVADSILKDFMRGFGLGYERATVKQIKWAMSYYFEDEKHPFKAIVNNI